MENALNNYEDIDYSLRIYDTELMRFSMEKKGLLGLVTRIILIDEALTPEEHLQAIEKVISSRVRQLLKEI